MALSFSLCADSVSKAMCLHRVRVHSSTTCLLHYHISEYALAFLLARGLQQELKTVQDKLKPSEKPVGTMDKDKANRADLWREKEQIEHAMADAKLVSVVVGEWSGCCAVLRTERGAVIRDRGDRQTCRQADRLTGKDSPTGRHRRTHTHGQRQRQTCMALRQCLSI